MKRRAVLIGLSLAALGLATPAQSAVEAPKLPLDFVENRGQWNTPARFAGRKGAVVAALESSAIVLHAPNGREPVRLEFVGASSAVQLSGENRRRAHYNFFHGNDPARWVEKAPAFAGVLYRGLYVGIDLRVREEGSRIEYDVLLAPDADVEQVVIRCAGVESIQPGPGGELWLQTANGVLRQTAPKTWEVLPDGTRRALECRFRILDGQRYGFVVPERDRKLELVIDPGVEWSTYLGGSGSDQLTAVAVARDGTGDVLVAGYMNSADFPFFTDSNFTPFQNRAFVARLDSTGTTLFWATSLGGWHSQVVHRGLAAAPDGGAALVGETASPDFPTTPGAFDRTAAFGDAFVVRFNPAGGLVFSTLLGGASGDDAYAVGFDPSGAVVVGGNTSSSDFPTTPGAFDTTYNAPNAASEGGAHGDIFITRLSLDGSAVTYSTFLGGPSLDVLEDMAIDSLGVVTLVGWVTGNNVQTFVTTADAFDRTWNGTQDAILARLKLDGAGAADLKYATLLGGSNQDNLFAVAIDPANPDLVTVGGMSWSDNFPVTAGVFKTTNPRFSALFESQAGTLARFHLPASGARTLVWSTYVGPEGPAANIRVTDITVNDAGEPITVGLMGDRRWPTTRGAFDRTPEGLGAGVGGGEFIARFSANASQLLYSSYIGGSAGNTDQSFESPQTVLADGNTVIVAGTTGSVDLPVTTGAFDTTLANLFGGADGFAMRFTTEPDDSGDLAVGTPIPLSPPNGTTVPSGTIHARLQWSPVADPSGIDGYQFELSTQQSFASPSYSGTVHDTEEVILPPTGTGEQGLTLTTWFWRVRAVDFAGNVGEWSTPSSFTVNAPSATPAVSFVQVFPSSLVGGASGAAAVHLDKPAPPGGQTVALTMRYNRNTGQLAPYVPFPVILPATVTVPAGATTAQFPIQTTPISQPAAVDILATINGVGRTFILTVKSPADVETRGVVISPATVEGGTPSTGTVTLKSPAPPGGIAVKLGTSHPQAARVPASITVPEGATQATFPITTFPVPFDIDSFVDVSAGAGLSRQFIFVKPPGGPRLTSLTLNPTSASGGTTVTGTLQLSGPVPFATWPALDGARVSVASSDPTVAGFQPFITVSPGASSATFTFLVRSIPANTTVQIRAAYDDVTLAAPLSVSAGPPVTLTSVNLNVSNVASGQGGIATVQLSAPAPAGGIVVRFSANPPVIMFSSNPEVVVGQGSSSASAAFIANPVDATTVATITASYGSSSASAGVTVRPSTANHWVTGVTLSPTSVNAGQSASGTVTINAPAPSGGIAVQLFSNSSAAAVPANVTVPGGSTSASFTVTTTSVSSTTTATITALLNMNASAPLTINAAAAPPPAPGTPSLLSPANDSLPNQPITFDWSDAANAARYEIYIDDSSTFSSPLIRQLTTTESRIIVTGLAAVRHWWRVRAFNSAGVASSFSSTRRFTPRAAPAEASLSALSVSPTSVVGGNTAQGTVTLTGAAPSGGAVVSLSSANPAVATVPASVAVPAGATSASLTINTTAVSANTSVNLTATYNSLNRSATLTVTSASTGSLPAPTLSSPANDARFSDDQTITFDWSDVTGAASYTLQIDDADTFSSLVRSQNTTQSRYSTSSLPSRRLWWRVRANDASGNPGAWSSVRRLEVRD